MRACAACGQPVPIKWRNAGPPPERIHLAGPVVVERAHYTPGFPWGRMVDRHQSCETCGEVLIHGLWAMFFAEGARVLEHGWRGRGTIMRDATDRDDAPQCGGELFPELVDLPLPGVPL